MKVLLDCFHLNGRTLEFYPQTSKLEHLIQHISQFYLLYNVVGILGENCICRIYEKVS